MRRRRVWIAASFILIAGVTAAVASIAASGGPGSTGGGGPGLHGLLSQIQSSFGDGRLLSASANGRTLTVKVAAPNEPSAVGATFEAQMLAAALYDSQTATGETAINSVRFVDAHGKAIPGYGLTRVGTDTSGHPLTKVPALANGACDSAAHAAQAADTALTIQSALTLPYVGGGCAFKFQTSNPPNFDYGPDVYQLANAMGDPDQRPILVEVDNQAGVPMFVSDNTPSGGGVEYTKPRSNVSSGP